MAMTTPLHGYSVQAPLPAPETPAGRISTGAMARILVMALLYGAASVPAFVAGVDAAGWCLAILAVALVSRFPMAGLCAVTGGGAYLAFSVLSLVSPGTLGPSGLFDADPWMQACAWLTLAASLAAVGLMNVPTFNQAFRREGRPVASWTSIMGSKS